MYHDAPRNRSVRHFVEPEKEASDLVVDVVVVVGCTVRRRRGAASVEWAEMGKLVRSVHNSFRTSSSWSQMVVKHRRLTVVSRGRHGQSERICTVQRQLCNFQGFLFCL
jgi:hypothetical protein